jgi:hypothetical protein
MTKTCWLLVVCGIFDAIHAAMNLLMLDLNKGLTFRRFALMNEMSAMGVLAMATGAFAVAAGWSFGRDRSWLLSLHGFALGAFGLIPFSPLMRAPLSFRPISLLFVIMATSTGVFAFGVSSRPRWLPSPLGVASLGFAVSFFAVGFSWVRLGPHAFWIWMSSYFAFCAIFMLWVALSRQGEADSRSGGVSYLQPSFDH